ncbi:hypothetical protein ACJRO7_014572 [Eucalyptus globulus]|uniref:Uncharacterized protein n=1 Tax=Eucalyptus globulus TaxID=34317 RepID=A0ABD3L0N0_EUCGL
MEDNAVVEREPAVIYGVIRGLSLKGRSKDHRWRLPASRRCSKKRPRICWPLARAGSTRTEEAASRWSCGYSLEPRLITVKWRQVNEGAMSLDIASKGAATSGQKLWRRRCS